MTQSKTQSVLSLPRVQEGWNGGGLLRVHPIISLVRTTKIARKSGLGRLCPDRDSNQELPNCKSSVSSLLLTFLSVSLRHVLLQFTSGRMNTEWSQEHYSVYHTRSYEPLYLIEANTGRAWVLGVLGLTTSNIRSFCVLPQRTEPVLWPSQHPVKGVGGVLGGSLSFWNYMK